MEQHTADSSMGEESDATIERAAQARLSLASLPTIEDVADATAPADANAGVGETVLGGAALQQAVESATHATVAQDPDMLAEMQQRDAALESLLQSSGQPQPLVQHPLPTSDAHAARHGGGTLKRVLIAVAALAFASCAVYLVGAWYFSSHFFPKTTVNGDDVSGMSVADLSAYVSDIGNRYAIHVSGDGLDFTVPGKDISFVYDGDAYGKEAGAQIDNWSWPVELSRPHAYTVNQGISYDEGALSAAVEWQAAQVNEHAQPPTNASMAFDSKKQVFSVVRDALGTAVDAASINRVVQKAVGLMQDEVSLDDAQLIQPSITSDNETLLAAVERANALLDNPPVLRIAGSDATKLEKKQLGDWIILDADMNFQVNEDAIREWTQGKLSQQFDTCGTKRSYTRPDGKNVEVEGSSAEYDYGWRLDGAALATTLAENLRNASSEAVEVPMAKSAASWNPGGQDWPARYIDVDLTEQHVRFYDESSNIIWESDCVSGDPNVGGGTDTGVYAVYRKASPEVLRGLDYNGDGQPDYESPVTYWMPFDGGEGLHDAGWRGSYFGGEIYKSNGSHGCVNLPYDAAEQLYGIVEVGDPVVVHW